MEVLMQVRTLCVLRPPDATHAQTMMLSYTGHEVVLVGSTSDMNEVGSLIKSVRPDLVFYDPTIDEGEMLVQWQSEIGLMPVLVCWSREPTYAVLAFEAGAVHYLMDCGSVADLHSALERCARRIARYSYAMQLQEPIPEAPYQANVIALPVTSGIEIRPREQIVHLHGEGNYTRVIFERGPELLLSRTIGEYDEVLQRSGFLRVHRSHLVNLLHVRKLVRGKTTRIQMSNGDEIDVSERYRDVLLEALNVVRRK